MSPEALHNISERAATAAAVAPRLTERQLDELVLLLNPPVLGNRPGKCRRTEAA